MAYCPTCNGSFTNGQFCPKDGARLQPDGPEDDVAKRDPMIGQIVADRFTIISRLGQGGMGTVYEARHRYIEKRVALKLLNAEITEKPDALARFQREALSASTIGHENIVAIDDFGRLADGQVYLTMEYLDGQPLNQAISQGAVSPCEVVDVAIQVCHGLAAAHAKGIVHRDMKPENIFLVEDGRKVKIFDFGIAKVTRADTNTNLTKTGAIFGTPNYMAPEQALGKPVDHRADIYAMGVILYEMLTGHVPFRSDSFLAILTQHVTRMPTPPSEAAPERQIPSSLEQVVLKAMAKDPDDRYQNMGELVEVLLGVRREVVGLTPLASHLRLSKIMPPSSETPTTDELPAPITGPGADAGKVTATAGELVEAIEPPRKRRGIFIGLAVAALLLGGVAALLVTQLGRRTPAPGGEPAASIKAAGGDPAPDVGPTKPPQPQFGQIFLSSRPSEATIRVGGEKVGVTPGLVKVPVGKTVSVELKRVGYQTREFEVKVEEGKRQLVKEVRLKPLRSRRAARLRRRIKKRTQPSKAAPARKSTPPPAPRRSDHGDHGGSSHGEPRGDHSGGGSSHGDH
jgi:eukaryotic-like serine/threonine-protein kinase